MMKSKLNLVEKDYINPSNSVKYLGVSIDKFLHRYDQVNKIAVKLNWANALEQKLC